MRKFEVFNQKSIVKWLFIILAVGVSLSSPYGAKRIVGLLIEYIRKNSGKKMPYDQKQITQALYQMKKRKIIKVEEKNGNIQITLTEKGRKIKITNNLEKMEIEKPTKWDGNWRFLMFDIPEKKRELRDSFRDKIKSIGFIEFQKSVWIFPYPCEKEITFISESLSIARYMTLMIVKVEEDGPLKKQFNLN